MTTLDDIAKTHLDIKTLKSRGQDCLDFHEVSVWQVSTALEEAYAAGMYAARGSNSSGVHMNHCNQGEYLGSCKYGEDSTCPAMQNF